MSDIAERESVFTASISVLPKNLPEDVLGFRLEKLAIPDMLKVRLRYELDIATVGDILRALPPGNLAQTGFGPRRIAEVWQQVALLAERGGVRYLREQTLDGRSFLELINIIREEFGPKDLSIFDYRICPIGVDLMTLQDIGIRLHLTRERVRQREQRMIFELQDGSLKKFSSSIERKMLALFPPPIRHLTFRQLHQQPFFAGVHFHAPGRPGPFIFFGKVFHKSFEIGDQAVSLTETAHVHLTSK